MVVLLLSGEAGLAELITPPPIGVFYFGRLAAVALVLVVAAFLLAYSGRPYLYKCW